MEKYFVTYKQAVALKEIGYNKYSWFGMECSLYKADGNHTFYANGIGDETYISAPLKSQVFEFFRSYRLTVVIEDYLDDYEVKIVEWALSDDRITHEFPNRFDSWGDAESAAIDKLIELVKNK